MKTSAWIVAAGLALGVAGLVAANAGASRVALAPAGDEKVDLTPKYKAGQVLTFKQRTVRKETMTLGGSQVPKVEKPAETGAGGKTDAPKGDTPKADAPKTDGAKPDAAKEPAKDAAQPAPVKDSGAKPPERSMSATTSIDQTATYELRVIEANDKGAAFELEFKRIVASGELPSGKYSWDSDTPPDDKDAGNAILVAYRPLVGAVIKIKVDADGNISNVEQDARVHAMYSGPLAPCMRSLVGSDGVRIRWATVLGIKDRREPAVVGQSWTNVEESLGATIGKFVYTTTNTVKSVKAGMANIDIVGKTELVGNQAGGAPQGTLSGQVLKGACVWDANVGAIKSHVWEQKQTEEINAGGFRPVREVDLVVTTTRE